jgi:hypothetical protein
MKLNAPSDNFISQILLEYKDENKNLDEKLKLLFVDFYKDNSDKTNILIKVATLNKIYSTAILNINPVVDKIHEVFMNPLILDYKLLVDEIATVEWKTFKRRNLSFASKFMHFHSSFEIPIYDSYVWILIKTYIGYKNGSKISFKPPKSYIEFYNTFEIFLTLYNLLDTNYTIYEIDKFLWKYSKKLIEVIQINNNFSSKDTEKSKSLLMKELKLKSLEII